jgi:hypothetical protein
MPANTQPQMKYSVIALGNQTGIFQNFIRIDNLLSLITRINERSRSYVKPRTWKFLWFCGGVLLAALWKMG